MKYWILGGGAIVSSALAFYGWTQPSTPEQGVAGWEDEFAEALPLQVPDWLSQPLQESGRTLSSLVGQAPEDLPFNLQWSGQPSNRLPAKIEAVYGGLLGQAQTAANGDRLAEALAKIDGIPRNSQHYELAQQLQENWSQELLQRATKRCQQGDVKMAIAMVKAIPQTSQQYERATELQGRWSQQAVLLQQALTAKSIGDWNGVISSLEAFKGTPLYLSLPVQQLLQQAINQLFEPDARLMQLAYAEPAPEIAPMLPGGVVSSGVNNPGTAAIEPLPASPLVIDFQQAMQLANPATATAAATPAPTATAMPIKVGKPSMSATTYRQTDEVPWTNPAIASPETLPESPRQKAATSPAAKL